MQDKFTEEFSKELNENNDKHDWHTLKACLTTVAAKTCGKRKMTKKQTRMAEDILEVMEERRNYEHDRLRYAELTMEIRKLCRKAKQEYHKRVCKEKEEIDRKHNLKAYNMIKKLTNKRISSNNNIKDKDGNTLTTEQDILLWWAEYKEEGLYRDKDRPLKITPGVS